MKMKNHLSNIKFYNKLDYCNAILFCYPSDLNNYVEPTDGTSCYRRQDNFNTFTCDTLSNKTAVSSTTEEILSNEKSYVTRLNYVIRNYMLPSLHMGEQMKVIFGNIEEIRDFHENIFYPDLLQNQYDLIRLIECFSMHFTVTQAK